MRCCLSNAWWPRTLKKRDRRAATFAALVLFVAPDKTFCTDLPSGFAIAVSQNGQRFLMGLNPSQLSVGTVACDFVPLINSAGFQLKLIGASKEAAAGAAIEEGPVVRTELREIAPALLKTAAGYDDPKGAKTASRVPPNAGMVTISSEPSGATVAINEILAGTTPLAVRISPLGVGFTVAVTKSGFDKWILQSVATAQPSFLSARLATSPTPASIAAPDGSDGVPADAAPLNPPELAPPAAEDIANLAEKSLPDFSRESVPPGAGFVTIRSEPSGATVMINDLPAGLTPLALRIFPVGVGFTVTLTKSGFEKWMIQSVATRQPSSLNAQLEKSK